jgi:hydrogenase maturation protein HypF
VLRRARGYAPGAVATLPSQGPILALGADLKNTITLVVNGQAFVSQHVGDLEHYQSRQAFEETIRDLVSMYEVDWNELLVVHDCHPQYASTLYASKLRVPRSLAVQHHRAHAASVMAERAAFEKRVAAVSFDGTGYGDDGSIWGGEIFIGGVQNGFERIGHLRSALLPGGDAAAQYPVQAAAGFLAQVDELPDLTASPFHFPARYQTALELVRKNVRTFPSSSIGRLFDTAAALLGFTRPITFEGQAAMWLEHLARGCGVIEPYPFPFTDGEFDFRPLLLCLIRDRQRGRDAQAIARSVQRGIALGLTDALIKICGNHSLDTVVLSGGVFQNELLLEDLNDLLKSIEIWTNHAVPPNDGGISLGQAALASFEQFTGGASNAPQ